MPESERGVRRAKEPRNSSGVRTGNQSIEAMMSDVNMFGQVKRIAIPLGPPLFGSLSATVGKPAPSENPP